MNLVTSGEISLERIAAAPVDEARAELMKIKGVGPKVADCTMLYGMYKTECFPVDVWIKRVLAQFYPNGLPEFIKPTAGIAQQYLSTTYEQAEFMKAERTNYERKHFNYPDKRCARTEVRLPDLPYA